MMMSIITVDIHFSCRRTAKVEIIMTKLIGKKKWPNVKTDIVNGKRVPLSKTFQTKYFKKF